MSLTSAHLTAVGLALLTLIAAIILMQERRMPQSTLAWLLAIVIVPYLAAPLFLLLGTRKFRRRQPRPHLRKSGVASSLAATFVALGAAPLRDGNRVRLVDNPTEGWHALMGLAAAARHSLDAEFYLISDDAEGRAFLALLAEKATAGVRVRLLLDRIGSFRRPRTALARLAAAGGEIRWLAPLVNRWSRGGLNLRNHRKVIICDGTRLMTGGMNVGADYVRSGTGPYRTPAFDDLNLCLDGPAVADYVALYRADWAAAGGARDGRAPAPPAAAGTSLVQLVASGPDRPLDALHQGLAHAIHRAERRVWIATPYFLPTETLATALATAAHRGLDVRLLVPRQSNHRIADFARGAWLRGLQAEGCRIFLAPSMVHAKAGTIDDLAWVGTANLDVRSLLLNFETALMLHDGASVAAVAAWFEARFARSREGAGRANLVRRLGEGLFRLGAPLL